MQPTYRTLLTRLLLTSYVTSLTLLPPFRFSLLRERNVNFCGPVTVIFTVGERLSLFLSLLSRENITQLSRKPRKLAVNFCGDQLLPSFVGTTREEEIDVSGLTTDNKTRVG